jgi:biotin operon repressor
VTLPDPTEADAVAKPDLNDGWHKFAYELEAAVNAAPFSRVARILLRYVFAQLYGKGVRPVVAQLPQSEIARRLDLPRQNVWRAVAELVGAGVLVEVSRDVYRFVKDYQRWKDKDGRPLLSDEIAEDCRLAPQFGAAFDLSDPASAAAREAMGFNLVKPDPVTKPSVDVTGSGYKASVVKMVKPDPVTKPSVDVTGCGYGVKPDPVTKPSPLKNPLLGIESLETTAAAAAESREKTPSELLVAWVLEKLDEQQYDEDAQSKAERFCRRSVASGLDPETVASCYQKALDDPNVLDKTAYAQGIATSLEADRRAGRPAKKPAICDFRVRPAAAPRGRTYFTAPPPNPKSVKP